VGIAKKGGEKETYGRNKNRMIVVSSERLKDVENNNKKKNQGWCAPFLLKAMRCSKLDRTENLQKAKVERTHLFTRKGQNFHDCSQVHLGCGKWRVPTHGAHDCSAELHHFLDATTTTVVATSEVYSQWIVETEAAWPLMRPVSRSQTKH
jgi:hypothetical protein